MPVDFTKIVKPSDFDLRNGLDNSILQNREEELIACSIIAILAHNGDRWIPFSFAEYRKLCAYNVFAYEELIFEQLVKIGMLKVADQKYSVTHRFIGMLCDFIKTA
ncbi:MAG: hypothetical protein QOG91_413 [Candidatus Parcubacteria bacterium]|nr:hypothetical protein [Candidatus Parcubacteria bacterium]